MNEHQLMLALIDAFERRNTQRAAELLRSYVSAACGAVQSSIFHYNDRASCMVRWPTSESGLRGPLHRCGLAPGHSGKCRCAMDNAEEPG